MKPEKVKSRWRRTSELETGSRASVSMGIDVGQSVPMSDKKESVSETKNTVNAEAENSNSAEDVKNKLPQYEAIEENLYLFERKRSKRKKEARRMVCECSISEKDRQQGVLGCQDECLNRLLMIECGSRCATGDACSNKRFQKRLYPKVEPFKTEKKGWGLKLLEDVPIGNFIIEYVGEILNTQEFKQRVKQYAREKSSHYYFMALRTDEILDATNKGNLSRFINHSCDPNCVTQKWTVNGDLRIGFFAKRDLKSGEELTFDYQFQRYGREAQKCYCGSEICSGYIGVSNQISLDKNINKSNNKRKRTSEEKKQEDLEDLIEIEQEIEKLSENGGLRNKEEALLLARLMVRAEDFQTRGKLLDILLGTTEIGCLRLFLDYHGLSLLWSWMVDITESKLKTKILQVLLSLPIPNKTMLYDSKVFSVVERWATKQSASLLTGDSENSLICDKKPKSCDTSDSDTPVTSDLEENCTANAELLCPSNEESRDVPDEDDSIDSESILTLSNNLLSSWKELKEEFRIPRREPIRTHCNNFSYRNERNQRNMCRHCRNINAPFCNHYKQYSKHRDTWGRQNRFHNSENETRNFRRNPSYYKSSSLSPIKRDRRDQFTRSKDNQRWKTHQHFNESSNYENSDYYQYPDSEYSNTNSNYAYNESSESNYDPFYFDQNQTDIDQQILVSNSMVQDTANIQAHPTAENMITYDQNLLYPPSHPQVPFVGTPLPTVSHQSSIPLTTVSHQPSAPLLSTPHQPSAPLLATPHQPAGPLLATPHQPSAPLLATPHQPSAPLLATPHQPSAPLLATPHQSSTPLPATPHQQSTQMLSAAHQLSPLPLISHQPNTSMSTIPLQPSPQIPTIPHQASPQIPTITHQPSPQIPTIPLQPSVILSDNNPPSSAISSIGTLVSPPIVPVMPVVSEENAIPSSTIVHQSYASEQTLPPNPQISESYSDSPIVSQYIPNSDQFVNGQNEMYYSQSLYSTLQSSIQSSACPPFSYTDTNGAALVKGNSQRLPANWKTATDADGNIYYYHVVTRQTQWDPPEPEIVAEPDEDTPTYDEPKVQKIVINSLHYCILHFF